MNSLNKQEKQRKQQLQKLKRQMEGLRNEMEFVEILAQFWPLPNMSVKFERLQERFNLLDRQYRHYASMGVAS